MPRKREYFRFTTWQNSLNKNYNSSKNLFIRIVMDLNKHEGMFAKHILSSEHLRRHQQMHYIAYVVYITLIYVYFGGILMYRM